MDGAYGVQNAIDDIASMSIAQTMAEQAPDEVPVGRDEKGRFAPKASDATAPTGPTAESEIAGIIADVTAPAPATEEAPETVPSPDEGPETVAMPEGWVPVPKVEGRELATQFTLRDKDGELEVPDLIIEFNANGKTRREPLDKVVRMAQFGVYNEEREQTVQQTKREMAETQARFRRS